MGMACVSVRGWSSGRQDASLRRNGRGADGKENVRRGRREAMILAHWYAGRSKNQIAESLGLDRKTVRKYLAPAEAEGLAPGGPPVRRGRSGGSGSRGGSRNWPMPGCGR